VKGGSGRSKEACLCRLRRRGCAFYNPQMCPCVVVSPFNKTHPPFVEESLPKDALSLSHPHAHMTRAHTWLLGIGTIPPTQPSP